MLCTRCSCVSALNKCPRSVSAVHLYHTGALLCQMHSRPSILCIDKCAYNIRFLLFAYQRQMSERKRGLCPAVMYRFLMPVWRVAAAAAASKQRAVLCVGLRVPLAQPKLKSKTISIRLFILFIVFCSLCSPALSWCLCVHNLIL